jgi:nucleoside-diphosphate-sugar epimerase
MRVVITGGAGFIGSHLIDALLARGDEVVAVDNLSTGRAENVAHLAGHPRFKLSLQDVARSLEVDGAIDAVLHLASPASPVDYHRLPIETLRVGSAGTFRALDLAVAGGARFLLASTSEVYGDPEEHPQRETYWGHVNPIGPRSVYDEAKRFAEAATMAYHRDLALDVRISRTFNTYGPRMRPDDGRVVSNFVVAALAGRPLVVHGDGAQTRSFCYVADQVAGLVALLESDHVGPVNIGNPDEFSVLELATIVRTLTGGPSEVVFAPLPLDDPLQRRPDITLAQTKLAWSPNVGLEDGLRRTISWFRERG